MSSEVPPSRVPEIPPSAGEPAPGSYAALFRIHERYARTDAARARLLNPHMLSPAEAVRLVAGLGGGSLSYTDDSEPQVQDDDLLAALRLLPGVRAELDDLEAGLLTMARGEGATWSRIAAASGLDGAQAAEDRHDRLVRRAGSDRAPGA
jgi:hypothetical protein